MPTDPRRVTKVDLQFDDGSTYIMDLPNPGILQINTSFRTQKEESLYYIFEIRWEVDASDLPAPVRD